MADSGEILEGFLCSICLTDLKTPIQLTKHFEDVHNEDPEILKSLKDLFGKAKQKILKQEENGDGADSERLPVTKKQWTAQTNRRPQEIGPSEDRTPYFKSLRDARLERYSTETNKLLIRLDKLLDNLPVDPHERREHEKSIVPWIDDRDVRLCPTCARSFGLARRKHHCRLCGAVMCNDCTMFVSLTDARKMTSPVSQDDSAVSRTAPESRSTSGFVRAGAELAKPARSPSSGSSSNVFAPTNDPFGVEGKFRSCVHCKNLLDARERLEARRFLKPITSGDYDEMRNSMDEATRYSSMYDRMWRSLRAGETTYDLRDAQILRMKIAKIGENVDSASKRIVSLGATAAEDSTSGARPQDRRLYRMIRTAAVIFLKERVLSVPSLPTEEEYAEIVAKRQRDIRERIAHERQLETDESQQSQKRSEPRHNDRSSRGGSPRKSTELTMEKSDGWGPTSGTTLISSSSMDPMVEQMSNLRSYIKQARAECKYDEVATLEKNLRELQSAYFVVKQKSSDG